MTYETAVAELFERFPDMRSRYRSEFDAMGEEAPAYVVFGSLLVPTLEAALERRDLRTILTICAYLEDASESAGTDSRLHDLIRIEIGEWLGVAANEEVLSPWLGAETKRICGYVPGLATQRRTLKMERDRNRWGHRIAAFLKKRFGR